MKNLIVILFLTLFQISGFAQESFDLIIVGGGASGTAAGISAGRLGTKTLIIESTPWLGGMLTSAGVSAI
ncbi:MAG TPA: FAD-dependent oxidoreductase, partial [Algoriphagus sp.]|nr:FAD-dependent oxidoreductase [Algoriphagus sp.]